ncbi:DUF3616 domain-containing protein [Rhizobium hidalgonense]|uniref:DUF3616 domain-containing protein n=1 Tax=Rhizobium hidalgonense TaxID=1538159 RepID=A0AAJ2LR02_9HYPH|nr:DUF3616 domain-containing protein [Rhizobium hidalgonense]MDR9777406.1 DUF3616 domain-containing protein [Rhizobium hidalgonense]MDR9814632.1 DUF3616 domain-containing protein [Rhizobium hidalgonense]MDR9823887.1 DUF3616 domain-containing protein [Rhizobium hidalgonense]
MRFQVWSLGSLLVLLGAAQASEFPNPIHYKGLCEASAATYIDNDHFVVASDETNILRLYTRNDKSEGVPLDFEHPSGFDKSDIEAAARDGEGEIVYWISSHSLNSSGEDKDKRKIFFATKVVAVGKAATLQWEGDFLRLRDAILGVIGDKKSELNIEGLATAPDGALLIGLRDTIDGKAVVIPFTNPAEVISHPERSAVLGEPFRLDLGGLGIRSVERVDDHYLIVAGPVSDQGPFALYRWLGGKSSPEELKAPALGPLRPEALMQIPGSGLVQILSDDGSQTCDDEKTPLSQRTFRSIEIKLGN